LYQEKSGNPGGDNESTVSLHSDPPFFFKNDNTQKKTLAADKDVFSSHFCLFPEKKKDLLKSFAPSIKNLTVSTKTLKDSQTLLFY
jgi:hypothetical protein